MFSHDRALDGSGKDEWLTPPDLVRALGPFDLDPCAPVPSRRPWATAAQHYSIEGNGLLLPWSGRIWLNPPYGTETHRWMARLAEHGDGIALIFARTETATFFESIWGKAHAALFLKGRVTFHEFTCSVCGKGLSHKSHRKEKPRTPSLGHEDYHTAIPGRDTIKAEASAGAPSVLIAYGDRNAAALRTSGLAGCYIDLSSSLIIPSL